jgi:hypothetical protein
MDKIQRQAKQHAEMMYNITLEKLQKDREKQAKKEHKMVKFTFENTKTLKTKEDARQYAIDYQKWTSKKSLSYSEVAQYQCLLETIGRKFNLLREFKENGIL